MSQNSEEVQKVIDQLEVMKVDFNRAINTMQSALHDGVHPVDEGSFVKSVTLLQQIVRAIALPMDRMAIDRLEGQF